DHAGAAVRLELEEELTAGLKALSRRQGTTLFMTLLAGWAVVLSRLSGQDDVVIGTPTANRGRREIEGLIGFFINTLALRVELSGTPTVGELLGRVKKRALEAQANQDIPFEQVVERVQPARSLAHSPIFQVMFNWQIAPGGSLKLPGLRQDSVAQPKSHATAKFDLSLGLRDLGGRIVGRVEYATSLFEQETVERHVGYLRRVLAEMAADERRAAEHLSLLPEAERAQVVEKWNRTEAAYPAELCLHELFEVQVERSPDAVAVAFEDAALSYAGLNRRANRLAHRLRAMGVGPDVRVAMCVERGLDMVVAVLGVLKAGGAYVPLDPEYPAERLDYMLRDSGPAVLLAHGSLLERFGAVEVPALALDGGDSFLAGDPERNPDRASLADHLAYVIYTSGSTGRPKGVMLTHRVMMNRLAWMRSVWGFGRDEVMLQNTSFSFDASVWEILLPLSEGARLVLSPPGAHRDLARVVDTVRSERVTTLFFVFSKLQLFLQSGAESCPSLARVISGGEPLTAPAVQRFYELLPAARLHNIYGPSEVAVAVTTPVARVETRVAIGRPVANTRVYVLDPAGSPVPIGAVGELFIGGAQVARGYLDRPELTAERFVPDPLGRERGGRLYRTGDVVRWLPDGRLEFVGRNDDQVKLRGFRVEPGEIEARLREHAQLREAAVVVREDAPGDRRLVAYYVGAEGVDVEALRSHLSTRLPEYMVPAAYVRLERLPLTPSGKLDRRALPAPEGDAYARRGYEAPAGETEAALAEIWSELLKVERVGRWDHFFDLGGHSLLAVQVISRVRQVLG
ncbi:MAG TPA: amino acid adenylation domain-containing protein, partial [Longimicrobiaceae bacterium]|nr:amino acid adenylation domain-containing protein [Longimicrobiaceae bacterium]